MTTQETWVHGTSGEIEVWNDDWGWVMPVGWGLHMDVNVRDHSPDAMPWVHFHIPIAALRPEAVDAPRLKKVMLKFATDCDKPGWFTKYPGVNADQRWRKDAGGAMIHQLHVWDADVPVKEFNDLNWQSDNLDTYAVESRDFPEEPKIHWGLGISVHPWFKNQLIVDWKIHPKSGEEYSPDWWDGKPFRDPASAATKSKHAVIAGVGCIFAAKP